MKTSKVTLIGVSNLVETLEEAWRTIAGTWGIPPAVIVIAPASVGGKLKKWGHYAGLRWTSGGDEYAEVLISAEGLVRGARGVFETLLHESVHAYQDSIDEAGTSRQGRYHNRTFKMRAEEFGLTTDRDPKIGCITPDITDECAEQYATTIAAIDLALKATRMIEPAGPKSARNGVVLICQCERKIRLTESVAEEGPIECRVCDSEFVLVVDDADAKAA